MSEPWWALLQAQWDSTVCPACSEEKWAHYPFCRKCSIRAQRINLMKQLKPLAGHSGAAMARTKWAKDWMGAYDRAIDYLATFTSEPVQSSADCCIACKQSFYHSMPAGKAPRTVVDLLKYPDFDFTEYPGIQAACKHCNRPLNGAAPDLMAT